MVCEKCLEMSVEETSGELDDSRSLSLMRHLVSCESCRINYERHLRLSELMKEGIAGERVFVPEDFSASVMLEIDKEILQTDQVFAYRPPAFSSIMSKIKSLGFASPSLYPIAAVSVLLMVVVSGLYYEKTGPGDIPLPLANARAIKAQIVDKKVLNAGLDKNALSYYLSRHEAKASRPSGKPVSRKANLVYTSYNAGRR